MTKILARMGNAVLQMQPSGKPKWVSESSVSPRWWLDALDDDSRLITVTVVGDDLRVDGETSGDQRWYRPASSAPQWLYDKVIKLSIMPEMHAPIPDLGRRARDRLYQILVPEHLCNGRGPKGRKHSWQK